MKKSYLLKLKILLTLLVSLLIIAGCSSSSVDNPIPTANVAVQLQIAGTTDYLVDGMTVSIQKSGGSILTGVTGTDGIANITVTEAGDYDVIQVTGVDASALAESNDTGREFVKSNPLADPYPNLNYTVTGVTVSVIYAYTTYPVDVTVPFINKVTVLKVGSYASPPSGNDTVSAGAGGFSGRVMMSNFSFSNADCTLGIWSNDANENRLVLYENATAVSSGTFYGGSGPTSTSIGAMTYALAGPVYFEAPGTGNGDWALGYNMSSTDLKLRANYGGDDATVNFLQFNGGVGNFVLMTNNDGGGVAPHNYSFNYRIFQFEQMP